MPSQRLLIIEDDSNISDLINCVAQNLDYEVKTANLAKEIARAYDRFQPDIVVLDILMPDIDGFEVLNMLRERKSQSGIIIISAQTEYLSMATHMADAFNLRIIGIIPKPFTLETLQAALTNKGDRPQLKRA